MEAFCLCIGSAEEAQALSGKGPGNGAEAWSQRNRSIACRPGFYKAFAGNIKCSKCPPHSSSHVEASSQCHCEKNFYRSSKDPPTMACTRPPSAPRNLAFNINETALFLEWTAPGDSGGRKDITYNVLCLRCGSDGQICETCNSNVRFIPRSSGITGTSVVVQDFAAHANYTFQIEAVNGVSSMGRSMRQIANITISTEQAGE
ncbi:hypothetical protein DNTS_011125 [Danionella cerebrum]|uniref:Fibronectin type-III domain-containing protein n=1 Tax=Danionella cerebrum TaxID=2873325 RepID=A0A553MME8_9TELE|nr:hypothetical protein DNTS_011125 [Danionella translucida]